MLPSDRPPQPAAEKHPPSERVIPSEQILQGNRQVWIEHQGDRYRLILTKNGRLILQK